MALAERKKLDPKFVEAVIEPMKLQAKEAKKRKPKSVVGKIPQQNDKTRDKVAKLHGTNAKSVSACERILAEHPEIAADIKSGNAQEARDALAIVMVGYLSRSRCRRHTNTGKPVAIWKSYRWRVHFLFTMEVSIDFQGRSSGRMDAVAVDAGSELRSREARTSKGDRALFMESDLPEKLPTFSSEYLRSLPKNRKLLRFL